MKYFNHYLISLVEGKPSVEVQQSGKERSDMIRKLISAPVGYIVLEDETLSIYEGIQISIEDKRVVAIHIMNNLMKNKCKCYFIFDDNGEPKKMEVESFFIMWESDDEKIVLCTGGQQIENKSLCCQTCQIDYNTGTAMKMVYRLLAYDCREQQSAEDELIIQ